MLVALDSNKLLGFRIAGVVAPSSETVAVTIGAKVGGKPPPALISGTISAKIGAKAGAKTT